MMDFHEIAPYYAWNALYDSARDRRSPFYGRKYHPTLCTNTVYNYYIHPQWDDFGSPTLYLKILYTDYERAYTIIELLGEWNDCIHNDIMFLKRNVIDVLIAEGIRVFILIGENVLNFHHDTDDYYQEWFEDVEDGFIIGLNFRDHVLQEFRHARLDQYVIFGGRFNEINWRIYNPSQLYEYVYRMIHRGLKA